MPHLRYRQIYINTPKYAALDTLSNAFKTFWSFLIMLIYYSVHSYILVIFLFFIGHRDEPVHQVLHLWFTDKLLICWHLSNLMLFLHYWKISKYSSCSFLLTKKSHYLNWVSRLNFKMPKILILFFCG